VSKNFFIPLHRPILPAGIVEKKKASIAVKTEPTDSFAKVLQESLADQRKIKFSSHAEKRLQQRNITLDPQKVAQLEKAVDKAEARGARESLILMNNLAFVVNIPNKTVITAMDQASMKENVFTNIDSAVII